MTGDAESVTTVTILNQTYQVRGSDDPEYVRELAGYVDSRMAELARSTPTVDSLRVAVLAALNIANDLLAARRETERLKEVVKERTAQMASLLAPYSGDRAT